MKQSPWMKRQKQMKQNNCPPDSIGCGTCKERKKCDAPRIAEAARIATRRYCAAGAKIASDIVLIK